MFTDKIVIKALIWLFVNKKKIGSLAKHTPLQTSEMNKLPKKLD